MLSKLDKKVRDLVSDQTGNIEITPDIMDNPLVGYLKVFQNQHRVIAVLYKSLIFAFAGFVLLLSLLIFNFFNNDLVPLWGAFCLGVIDLFLLGGIVKAFYELKRYRHHSADITRKIHEYLRNDLSKLEKIKAEQSFIHETQKRFQSRLRLVSDQGNPPKVKEHAGWDRKACPYCRFSVEMTAEVCPNCRQSLGKPPIN
jgi:hypothetical protein